MAIDPLFRQLLEASSTPGNEHPVRDILIEALSPFGEVHPTRWTGFYMTLAGASPDKPDVVLTAHMDSPGFTVREIREDGQIDAISLGGINPNLVQPRLVWLRTSQGRIPGVLHLEKEEGRQSSYRGFFGFKDKAAAEAAGVQKGDGLSWKAEVVELQGGYIAAPHCDNRVGCYLLAACARELSEAGELPVNVHFAATGCEEVGGRGARIMGQMIEPQLALCFDTTYEEGSVKMGAGPAVTLSDASVILPMTVRDQLRDIAAELELPLQFEVYNYAGTDASGFRDVGEGCLTICPLVASLNNHTAHEIIHLDDVAATRRLSVELVKRAKSLSVT